MIGETHCTGIGAPEVAAPWIDWRLGSEIDEFARHGYRPAQEAGVERHLWGDFTTLRPRHYRRLGKPWPEIIVAGTPCQAFSVAGLRRGTSDPRGQLTLAFVRHVHAIANAARSDGKPAPVILWENVPGVLTDADNAFGCFLGGLIGSDAPLEPPRRREKGRREPSAGLFDGEPDSAGAADDLGPGDDGSDDDEGEPSGNTRRAYLDAKFRQPERPEGWRRAGSWPSAGMAHGPLGRVAWRVLDAQHFGLAQRRARVWVVIDPRDGPDPAAVLFEPGGVRGNPAPREGAGQGAAADARPGARGGRWTAPVAPTLSKESYSPAKSASGQQADWCIAERFVCANAEGGAEGKPFLTASNIGKVVNNQTPLLAYAPTVAGALQASAGRRGGQPDAQDVAAHVVAFTAKDHGGDAGALAPTIRAGQHGRTWENGGVMPAVAFAITNRASATAANSGPKWGAGFREDQAFTLEARSVAQSVAFAQSLADPITANEGATYTHEGRGNFRTRNVQAFATVGYGAQVGDLAPTLQASAARLSNQVQGVIEAPLGVDTYNQCLTGAVSRTLGCASTQDSIPHVIEAPRFGRAIETTGYQGDRVIGSGDTWPALTRERAKNGGEGGALMFDGWIVRRLTPVECERLQGFPDGFTAVPWRARKVDPATARWLYGHAWPGCLLDLEDDAIITDIAPDSRRYKALGNSMAVPNVRWIIERICRLRGIPIPDQENKT